MKSTYPNLSRCFGRGNRQRQSLDGIAPFVWLPVFLAVWRWQAGRGREPGEFGKMAIGCLVFGASTMLLALANFFPDSAGKASILHAAGAGVRRNTYRSRRSRGGNACHSFW